MDEESAGNEKPANKFDNLKVDVARLYETHPIDVKIAGMGNGFAAGNTWLNRIYRNGLIPLRYRERFWQVAHRTRLDIEWFDRFRRYWSQVLEGRPLAGPEDFFFLKNWQRVKFQQARVADDADAQGHLAAWRNPELLFQLFHLVHKSAAQNETRLLRKLFQYCPDPKAILEFGCGTGPIAHSLFQFYPRGLDIRYYLSDLESLAFHYAAWQYRSYSNVVAAPLKPEKEFLFDREEKMDAICCMTVFEHLPAPLKVIKHFHAILKPGGILIFDYFKGDGGGMDTIQAVRERGAVLEHVRINFKLLEGELNEEKGMGVTIVRK